MIGSLILTPAKTYSDEMVTARIQTRNTGHPASCQGKHLTFRPSLSPMVSLHCTRIYVIISRIRTRGYVRGCDVDIRKGNHIYPICHSTGA